MITALTLKCAYNSCQKRLHVGFLVLEMRGATHPFWHTKQLSFFSYKIIAFVEMLLTNNK